MKKWIPKFALVALSLITAFLLWNTFWLYHFAQMFFNEHNYDFIQQLEKTNPKQAEALCRTKSVLSRVLRA